MTNATSQSARRARRPAGILAAIGLAVATAVGIGAVSTTSYAQERYWDLPRAEYDPGESGTQTVVLAGGCFWGIQGVYQHIRGVTSAVSGYAGGNANTATYSQIQSGTTGHAEAVRLTYDPSVISLGEILRVFFSVAHDPTTLNYQGSDVGPQYRSHIYTTTAQQMQVAEAYIDQLDAAGIYSNPIVTKLDSLPSFYPAEPYHQDYLVDMGAYDPHGPNIRYLQYWDFPKVENTQRVFPEYWRANPLLVAETHPDLAP